MTTERIERFRHLHAKIAEARTRWASDTINSAERSLEFEHLADLHKELAEMQAGLAAEQAAADEAQRKEATSPWLQRSRDNLAERARLTAILKAEGTTPAARAEAEDALAALPPPFGSAP